jgi:uncharacterized integral membrane protein
MRLLKASLIPIESFLVVVNDRIENVRLRFEKNTSEYNSWREGMRLQMAKDPNRLFVGEVGERRILISRTSPRMKAGCPFLRAKLVDDGNQTIVTGWLGLLTLVVIFVAIMAWTIVSAAFEKPARMIPLGLAILAIVVGGYLYERRQLFRALATCLEVDVRDLSKETR